MESGEEAVVVPPPEDTSGSEPPKESLLSSSSYRILHVHVVCAQDIKPRTNTKKRNLFVTIHLADQVVETSIKKKTLNPIWDADFEFLYQPNIVDDLSLEISLWDEGKHGSQFLGRVHLPLAAVLKGLHERRPSDSTLSLDTADKAGLEPPPSRTLLTVTEMPGRSYPSNAAWTPAWYELTRPSTSSGSEGVGSLCLGIYQELYSGGHSAELQCGTTDPPVKTILSEESLLYNRLHESDGLSLLSSVSSASSLEDTPDVDGANDAFNGSQSSNSDIPRPRSLSLRTIDQAEPHPALLSPSLLPGDSIIGMMQLDIEYATDLPLVRRLLGRLDLNPFLVISFGRLTYRTKVLRHSVSPVWHERLVFPVRDYELHYSLIFSIYDNERLRRNSLVCTASLDLDPFVQNPSHTAQSIVLTMSTSSTLRTHAHRSDSSPTVSTDRASDIPAAVPIRSGSLSASTLPHSSPKLPPQSLSPDIPSLKLRAKFLTNVMIRLNFWRILCKQYDHDDNDRMNRIEIMTMLESIGSTLDEAQMALLLSLIVPDSGSHASESEEECEIPIDRVAHVLEAWSQGIYQADAEQCLAFTLCPASTSSSSSSAPSSPSSRPASPAPSLVPSAPVTPRRGLFSRRSSLEAQSCLVSVKKCPICGKSWPRKFQQLDIITHLAVCSASIEDGGDDEQSGQSRQLNGFVMGGFLTETYASRKWFTKLFSYLGFGSYSVGKNNAHILVQERVTGRLIEEKIPTYIRLGLRLMYQNVLTNRAVTSRMVRNLLASLTFKQGRTFDSPSSVKQIPGFIAYHRICMDEVEQPLSAFGSFNEFFYRRLKPGARIPKSTSPMAALCPADCRLSVFESVSEATRLWIKGQHFSVASLLMDQRMARYYDGGSIAICRIAPQDYHRFHAPFAAAMGIVIPMDGAYYTVNPMAVRQRFDVFTENKRTVSYIHSDVFGRVAFVAIGAMMVGTIRWTAAEGAALAPLDEIGYFAFGGSTIIMIFAKDQIMFDKDLLANSSVQVETLVKLGDSLGRSPFSQG